MRGWKGMLIATVFAALGLAGTILCVMAGWVSIG